MLEYESINDLKIHDIDGKMDDLIIDFGYLDRINQLIKSQYQDFENLGIDLVDKIDKKYQRIVLEDFLEYANENYTPIIDNQIDILTKDKLLISKKTYQFLCVDFYSTILPSFLERYELNSFNHFERYLMRNIKKDYDGLKGDLIKIIQKIFNNIKKLENIDKNIIRDKQFREILNKYSFYIRLINYGDISNFVHNYWIPMFRNNEAEIMWKAS